MVRVKLRRTLVSLVSVAMLLPGCARHRVAGVPPATAPTLADAGQAHCMLTPNQLRPLVVEWSGADRGALELQLRRGVVAVRYEGCTLEILQDCVAPGAYAYAGFTRKHDTVVVHTTDDLYREIPIGASKLEAQLTRVGSLQVEMTLVGEYRVGRGRYTADELTGTCAGATHVLAAAQVGAFMLSSSADASIAASSAQSGDTRELLNSDGDLAACEMATPADSSAPEQCGALLRLEFSPIQPTMPKQVAVGPEPPAPASQVAPPSAFTSPPDVQRPTKRRPATRSVSSGALAVSGGIFGFVALIGIATIAAGAAGIEGDRKTHRDTTESYTILKTGIGVTVGAGALSGLLIGLAFRNESTRMGLAPRLGPGFGGATVILRF